jgi:membrane-associated phospholipid phosphatase
VTSRGLPGPLRAGGRPQGAGALLARLGAGAIGGRALGAGRARLLRGLLGTGIFAGGLWVYTRVQDLALPQRNLTGAWDAAIPFVPELVVVYFLFFPFVVLAAFAAERDEWLRILLACVLAAAVGWVCFLLFPASLERPDPAGVSGPLSGPLLRWLHAIDDSHNTFPSLHVAVTWIAAFGFRGTRGFVPSLPVAAAISGSTLFVKQHTLLDVAGGLVLAAACLSVATRVIPLAPSGPPAPRPRAPRAATGGAG